MAEIDKRKADYIIPRSIDLHVEVPVVPFKELSGMHIAETIGYRSLDYGDSPNN